MALFKNHDFWHENSKQSQIIEFEKQHLFSTHIFDKKFWGQGRVAKQKDLKTKDNNNISNMASILFVNNIFSQQICRGGDAIILFYHSKNRKEEVFMSSASRQGSSSVCRIEYSNKKIFFLRRHLTSSSKEESCCWGIDPVNKR